ncbi:ribonuclease H-like domain-containing protein [Tissierella sp. Yu-01]|uniref:ribonuclease H-like domain-containing protein n=1 Tax=Tissierella sp. Yu-01 TaxID=3035694 RepID=UPI00240E1252|nr:ribonuclease H-like domain-containing protein [Tissierella sp. Yu-01]WFA09447.1 ribonuclease H-like domain-containing protein [Tissierella sp. Yu-01]
MKEIAQEFSRDINYKKYFQDKNICFMDIETTGLDRSRNSIYLIGIQYYDKEKQLWALKQIFAESIKEEKELLIKISKILPLYDEIITYNGESFDIPFINRRLSAFEIPYSIDISKSMDIFRLVKKNKNYLGLENLKLKTLERYLGLYRDDLFTGKDCIDFYFDYIKSRNEALLNKIMLHNYEDLYYMIDILGIIDIINEKKTFNLNHNESELSIMIDDIVINGDQLLVNGFALNHNSIQLIHYDTDFKYIIDSNGKFEFAIDCFQGMVSPTEKGFYINKNNLVLSKDIIDSTKYELPKNILLLKVAQEYCIRNIKSLMTIIINDSLKQY